MTALDRLLDRLRRALHVKPRVVLPNHEPWPPSFYPVLRMHMEKAHATSGHEFGWVTNPDRRRA